MPDPKSTADVFDRIAEQYDEHAALEQECGKRLLERTEFLRTEPSRIFDLGCGTGTASAALKGKFKRAQVVGLDVSMGMLSQLRFKSRWFRSLRAVCGDMGALPFADGSAELIYSNLACHWCSDARVLFSEIRRVLRPGGMLVFTALGPGSMAELREAIGSTDDGIGLTDFPDLMVLGDILAATGFLEPVMDMEKITLHYPSLELLTAELEATGAVQLIENRGRLTSLKDRLEGVYRPQDNRNRYPLSFEIIYGTAFQPPESQPRRIPNGDVLEISVDSLLKSRPISYD